ncbi:MAG: hypothetical protein D6689_18935 [Deltaproteobacteria bacterium]|nr:MAG: hypothetical protein D6689_18935 [Deltaproteobacteria bacterium]
MSQPYLSIAAAALVAAGAGAAHAGTVRGTIRYAGTAPAPAKVAVRQDAHVCGKQPIYDESLRVGAAGGLANAVVSIEGAKGAAKPATVTVDQQGCVYRPHVQTAAVGATLVVTNSDAVLHNVHAFHGEETMFNVAQPTKGMRFQRPLDEVGVVRVKCDAGHTWMSAYVVVFDHPYHAVTGEDGSFHIDGVPPGTYKVKVWHETLGSKTGTVTVGARGAATFDLTWK